MLTNMISDLAVKCLETTGYVGAAALMALESMIAPVPSEAVMPFVGFLVVDGKWDLWMAVFATTIGSIIGSLASYLMGYYGGKPVVLKVGKYLWLDEHHLKMTENFFHRRAGAWTIFIARFVPIVRHLISIPAGMGRMPLVPFLIATTVGAVMWNSVLLYAGMVLRERWTIVQQYSHQVDIVLGVVIVAGVAWLVRSKLAGSRVQSSR